MKEILKENKTYILAIEETKGKYWLELHERKTGLCQTLICSSKKIAKEAFEKKGVLLSFNKIRGLLDLMKVEKHKVYKENT